MPQHKHETCHILEGNRDVSNPKIRVNCVLACNGRTATELLTELAHPVGMPIKTDRRVLDGLGIAAGQKPTLGSERLSRNCGAPPALLVLENARIAPSSRC
jgi:hypothetical protein